MRIICNVDRSCWSWGRFIRCPNLCYINSFTRYWYWCWYWCWCLRLSYSYVSILIPEGHVRSLTLGIPFVHFVYLPFLTSPFLTPSFSSISHFLVLLFQAFDKEMQQVRMFRLTDIAFVANLVTYTIPFHCKVRDGSKSPQRQFVPLMTPSHNTPSY